MIKFGIVGVGGIASMHVDNIITDNIKLGKELVRKSKTFNIENVIMRVLNS